MEFISRLTDDRGDYSLIRSRNGWCFRVDAQDCNIALNNEWAAYLYRPAKFYLSGRFDRRQRLFHRVICGEPQGMTVDHHDGDTMNCRRYNLRICTVEQNAMNRVNFRRTKSGLRGVYQSGSRWFAAISMGHQNKKKFLGMFDDPISAALAWDREAFSLRGEYTQLNFPNQL